MEIVIVEEARSSEALQLAEAIPAGFSVRRVGDKEGLPNLLRNASPPVDLVIAVQVRPKQFTQRWFGDCLAAAPLLRAIRILGPWCDGDLRTPGPLDGVLTLSFREANWRLAELLTDFRQGKGALARPLTALHLPAESPPQPRRRLQVGVALPGALATAAAEALAALGHTPHLQRVGEPPSRDFDLQLIDGDAEAAPADAGERPPQLKLCGFSRPEEGAALSKTFSIAELDAALRKLTAAAVIPESPISR